jgi:N-hydroxyarylamine O-acetyltransferase
VTVVEPLGSEVVDTYLGRIGIDRPRSDLTPDLSTLSELMLAHLVQVPFENLDVFHQVPVRTDLDWSVPKILDRHRGGWCFELNGAFGSLLSSLGFEVRRLGAAVLLNGPNNMIDHHCLEVTVDQPYLVDVGFGDTFLRPLALNRADEQDGGNGTYQFLPSPIGTTLAKLVDDVPTAHYRFKRVAHRLSDFDAASAGLADDAEGHFRRSPLVSRLLDTTGARVTLSRDRLVTSRPDGSEISSQEVSSSAWWPMVGEWFGIQGPIGPTTAGST